MALGKIIREFGVKLSLAWDQSGMEKANKSLDSISSTLKGVGLGVAAAAGTIFGFAEATASNAKQLELWEQTLGINAERLQELGYAAKVVANVSKEQLVGALEGVSKTLDDVRRGNLDAAFTFQRLGISQDVLANRSLKADQVMMMVADRIKDIQDPIARTAIATQVFGSAGAELLPLLMKGSAGIAAMGKEARNLGLVIDNKSLKSQAKFQESMNRIWMILQRVSYIVGGELIKVLTPLVQQFQNFVVHNRKLIATGIVEFCKGLGQTLQVLWVVSMRVVEVFKKMVTAVGGIESAVKIMGGAWLAFMGLNLAVNIASLVGSLWGFGAAILGAVAPIATFTTAMFGLEVAAAPAMLAIGAAVVVMHDLWKLMSTGKIEDTWIGQAVIWVKDFVSSLEIVKKIMSIKASDVTNVASSFWDDMKASVGLGPSTAEARFAGGGAGGGNNQFQTDVTVMVPPGTSATDAQAMVADGVNDGHKKMLRDTRNQAVGGVAY